MILGLDTSTASTSAAVLGEGWAREARDDPPPGGRPRHSERLLALIEEVVDDWQAVQRIAVGLGPGAFTGLRIGIATARGLSQSLDVDIVGVSSLRALAAGAVAREAGPVLAVVDARRGEAFVAAYDGAGAPVMDRTALAPDALAGVAGGHLAVGDGAVRFRPQLEAAGAVVPPDEDPVHRVSAVEVCRLAAGATAADRDGLVPDYVRAPDATARRQS